jgi:carboxylate-amine ligase
MLDENKWLASRTARGRAGRTPEAREGQREGARPQALRPPARARAGPRREAELEGIVDLLEKGTGASRQRVVYEANRDFGELMKEITEATNP